MATNIVTGLFGIDPAALQQQQQTALTNQALQYASLSPAEQSQYSGYIGGGLAGQAFKGMMGIEDPQMKKAAIAQQLATQFDITTAGGLRQYAQALAQNGAPDLAQMAVKRADEMDVSQATVAAKMREKVPQVGEVVNQALYADALRRANGDPIVAAQIYDAEEQAKKKSVAAAGAPPSGQVPLTVLDNAIGIVDKFTAKPKARLEQIGVLGQVGEAVKTNPTLLPQFKRDAVKFAGDNQVGQKEVKDILGSAGIAGDVIDGVNSFLTGAPTNAKIDDVLKGFKVLEKAYAKQYEAGRNKAEIVLTEGKINEQTRNAVLPPAYNITPKAAPITAPSLTDWLIKARAANPNTSDAELTSYYNTKYGKK